ncbi:transcription elongation factor Elf1 like-domain-containing protein [Massariosphaeria phaeospora]|uniref:Transcription elongation factor 1 homolog n=1 Tax=Massariosphaeria phaeospora TaxID=100035 RepID=A0A7C8I1K5_9PLEO|nr:transcription elongation factor Elf1 like-domain-containing protein [Massariosphaeria phaeospora]
MGKRKSAKKPQGPKKKEKLPTIFQCLFCNHENSVSVSIEKKSGVGNLHCKVCGQTFQTSINYLSAPVDVYADWIDACDQVAKEAAAGATTMERSNNRVTGPPKTAAAVAAAADDDFIVQDGGDEDAPGDWDEDV